MQRSQMRSDYSDADVKYKAMKTQYDTLINDGNYTLLRDTVQHATTSNDSVVAAYLLSLSPWLSDSVLYHMAVNTAFSDTTLYDVYTENIEGLYSGFVLDYVEANERISPTGIGKLRQVMGDTIYSARYVLEDSIAEQQTIRYETQAMIIGDLLDTVYDRNELRAWLDTLDNPVLKTTLAFEYATANDFREAVNMADTLLNEAETIFKPTIESAKVVLQRYKDWETDSFSVERLDSSRVQALAAYADTSAVSTGRTMARNILHFFYDSAYHPEPQLPSGIMSKKEWYEEQQKETQAAPVVSKVREEQLIVNLYPNPAKDKLFVEYIIPNGKTEGIIEMYDVHGRAVKIINLHNSLGKEEINITDWQNGIYHYKVICVNCNTQSGKVVIIK